MGFLGNVNVFHGRVEGGRAHFGPLALDYPEHPQAEARPAAGYARSYELDLTREGGDGGGLWATLRHVNPAGATAKLDLMDGEGRLIQVELPRERYAALAPEAGQRLFVRPRELRVFVETTPSV